MTDLTELLDRSATGDHAAFADVYDSTSSLVWHLLLDLVGDVADAADTAVETYEEVWRYSAHASGAATSPLAWILRVARTCADACLETRQRPPVT